MSTLLVRRRWPAALAALLVLLATFATPAVLEAVAEFATVTRIRAPRTYALSEPVLTAPAPVATGIAWGVTNIRADRVWQEYGVTGEGIVVSNIDTGVEFDAVVRIDTPAEANYFRHGGILPYVLRKMLD